MTATSSLSVTCTMCRGTGLGYWCDAGQWLRAAICAWERSDPRIRLAVARLNMITSAQSTKTAL